MTVWRSVEESQARAEEEWAKLKRVWAEGDELGAQNSMRQHGMELRNAYREMRALVDGKRQRGVWVSADLEKEMERNRILAKSIFDGARALLDCYGGDRRAKIKKRWAMSRERAALSSVMGAGVNRSWDKARL